MTGTQKVRSAARVLQVLEALNTYDMATVAQLAEVCGLPKPTVVRLLLTLVDGGYVERVSRTQGYVLAEGVLRLSDGFRNADRLVAAARRPLDAFTVEHKWPVNLQICVRGAMCTRYSTANQSALSIDPPRIGKRYPILTTAHGQAYLGVCADTERDAILAMLQASKNPANAFARDAGFVARMIADVQRLGYALRRATPDDRVVGFAVPVPYRDGVIATVGMRYFASAMTSDEATRRYLTPLREVAAAVSAAFDPAQHVSPGEIG